MQTENLFFFSVPGLRPADIDKTTTPSLYAWANQGALAELSPTFPCVTSCVQATMLTGTPPRSHGVIANGFFDRDRREVAFWVGKNDRIAGRHIWDLIRDRRRDSVSAVWHGQNIKGASADYIVTPAPIHEADGTTKLWCYSKPEGTYQQLVETIGHFPLQHYWGPLSNIQSTRWILGAALWLHRRSAPNFHWIYIPHLDYAAQKFGPNSVEAKNALAELDHELGAFARQVSASPTGRAVVYLLAGEYALTDVTGVIYPNRLLRQAGLLAVGEEAGTETLDLRRSTAFAMVDHQFAHVYLAEPNVANLERVRAVFSGVKGVAQVLAGDERKALGLDHPRSGDILLISDDDHWLAYYWWLNDAAAPPFARTVDIHRKPGYDPVELFFDPVTKGIPLNAAKVKGSHGVPATHSRHKTALICSAPSKLIQNGRGYKDTNVQAIALGLLGL